jgi:aldose 1-epimerase
LNEPDRRNAIHGLVRWLAWRLEARSEDKAELSCVIHPQPAYPFRVRLELDYELGDAGLIVTWRSTNTGDHEAPFGIGFHPYLAGGPGGIDEARIELPASRRLLLNDRGLPVGDEAVRGTAFDLGATSLDGLVLDDCYTGLDVGTDGRWHCRLTQPTRRSEIWGDSAFGYVMCYTPGSPRERPHGRPAIAIEPMTCPPNAFRTGTGLIELQPGEQREASWGISVVA